MNNYIEDLVKVGLTLSEAKVYFSLLKKKNSTATEIAKFSHVSRPKVYEVLTKLMKRGLCTQTLGRIRKYTAVNPKVGLDNVKKDLEERKDTAEKLAESLFPLYHSEIEKTDPLDFIQVIRERTAVMRKYISLMNIVKKEILVFSKPPYYLETTRNEQEGLNLLGKGIKARSIYELEDAQKADYLHDVEVYAEAGEEAKVIDELPMKLAIFDRKTVLCFLKNTINGQNIFTTLVIEHEDYAKSYVKLFDCYWDDAMTLEEFKMQQGNNPNKVI